MISYNRLNIKRVFYPFSFIKAEAYHCKLGLKLMKSFQNKKNFFSQAVLFLDASTQLYKRDCPSVRQSVHPSVRPSVRRSVRQSIGCAFFSIAEITWKLHIITGKQNLTNLTNQSQSLTSDASLFERTCYVRAYHYQ